MQNVQFRRKLLLFFIVCLHAVGVDEVCVVCQCMFWMTWLQKVARNQACSCGSKKKYKACCGAVIAKKVAFTITVKQQKEQGGKKKRCVADLETATPLSDVGSLCI